MNGDPVCNPCGLYFKLKGVNHNDILRKFFEQIKYTMFQRVARNENLSRLQDDQTVVD